jgi:hypothetical protein
MTSTRSFRGSRYADRVNVKERRTRSARACSMKSDPTMAGVSKLRGRTWIS